MISRRLLIAATAVAASAFALYHATLLPGLDFGDTGFFQTTVGELGLTPRNGYPLYFAIGNLFLWLTRMEAAHVMNLASAVEGAIACGVIVLAAAELSDSSLAGLAAALLFAVSYTFWSQAVIAEVYSLHILFVALTLLLLLRWSARPTLARLALFFAVYALGFGNHLSMVLLLPGYALFLLLAAPGGWRSMLRPRIVALALVIAFAGSLQYVWNLRALWQWPHDPPGLVTALHTFWFDVTKSDWRDTLVMHVPGSMLRRRVEMYGFDLFQQFGWAIALAPLGVARLVAVNWRRAGLMLTLYLANAIFAFTYNVGDTHVFYLPSHLIVALLMAPGLVALGHAAVGHVSASPRVRRSAVGAACALAIAYAGARAYRDYPALDRGGDHRPAEAMARMAAGLDDQHAILLADLNWQLIDGFAYFAKVTRPDIAFAWLSDVLLYAPALVRDNLAIGRDVVLTSRARATLARAYGPLLPTVPDPRADQYTITGLARDLPPGTRYVLCVLKPIAEYTIDRNDLARAVRTLTAATSVVPDGDYAALAGLVGRPPALAVGSAVPFRDTVWIEGVRVDVRMESWLEFDTIRRMGFGQVVAARRHTLIVERGVSFAAFDGDGRPLRAGYAANLFAPQPRYLVRP
jgi:Protein of unknown function (DUF2723)